MQLHFKEFGRGRAIILLHGMLGSADNWHLIAQRLAQKFHVLAVDQRNHGHSPHGDAMNYRLMAGDVNELLMSRGIGSALVLGHSMGGKTAMQFALQYPERAEKLIVADMAPRAYAPAHDAIFAALLALDLPKFQTRQEIEDFLSPEISNLALRRFLLKNLGRDTGGRFYWKSNLRGIADNYPRLREPIAMAPPYAKPALFLRGGKSDYVSAGDDRLIRDLFPAAEIRTMADAGHWLHADQPEEFLRHVLNFL